MVRLSAPRAPLRHVQRVAPGRARLRRRPGVVPSGGGRICTRKNEDGQKRTWQTGAHARHSYIGRNTARLNAS